jgi:uncharacterized protein (DUF924 family)
MAWVVDVNRFWFEELRPADWFSANPAVDGAIRTRFAELREHLKKNPPSALSAMGHLAAIIVFDQFSRNLFRGSPEAFATDSLALTLAEQAVDRGLDEPMGPHQREFLYMPFMHSEDPGVQARLVAPFRSIGIPEVTRHAEQHKAVIDRFGRFPNRNAALGRKSTEAESLYLQSAPPFP